jgi:type I restriction enzyme S subunit
MSADWIFSELGKEAINASRPFSFDEHPDVVFVNTGDVLRGNFLHANVSVGSSLPGQAKKALLKNDILLTEIRPENGRFAFVDFDASKYVVSTKFMVIESLGRVFPRFLFHILTNQTTLDEFQRIAESRSGTFPQITFDSIAHFPIPVPPEGEQKRLAEFFDALDDRITLLRETNATLEAIAQALFKSWFVDFDPVRAKLEGRAPEGMDEATARLFPDSLRNRSWAWCRGGGGLRHWQIRLTSTPRANSRRA